MTNSRSSHFIKRGKRFVVSFPGTGTSWTGRKVGKSHVPGRIKVIGEYVDWKGPIHVPESGDDFVTVTPISKDSPSFFRSDREEVVEVDRTETYRVFESRPR